MANPLSGSSAERPKRTPQEWCDIGNAHLAKIERFDVEWKVRDGRATIGWKKSASEMVAEINSRRPVMDRRGQPMSESDTFKLNKELERLGANARYRRDGSRYLIGGEIVNA